MSRKRAHQAIEQMEMILNGRYMLHTEADIQDAETKLETSRLHLDRIKRRVETYQQAAKTLAMQVEQSDELIKIRKRLVTELFAIAQQSPVVSSKLTRQEHNVLNQIVSCFRATTQRDGSLPIVVYHNPRRVTASNLAHGCFACNTFMSLYERSELNGLVCQKCYRQVMHTHDLLNLLVISHTRELTSDEAQRRAALISDLTSGMYHQNVNNAE